MGLSKSGGFEGLDVWESACKLRVSVINVADEPPLPKDWALRDQLKRSALSIPSNIAEGFERSSNKDFVSFLWIAKGSSGELRTQFILQLKQRGLKRNQRTSS